MDPLAQIVQFEATEGDGGGAAPIVPEPFLPAPAPEPAAAPAAEPEPAAWQGFNDEESFRAAVAAESAQMFDARMEALLQQNQQPAGPQGNLNELLDPMSPEFGSNLAQLLAASQQQTAGLLQPFIDQQNAAAERAQLEALAAPILAADTTRHGELSPEHHAVAMTLADAYTADAERIYGAGSPRAQQEALARALTTVRGLAGQSAAAGAQQQIDQLHAATSQLRVPAPGGGSVPTLVPTQARSPQEVLERHFGQNGMSPRAA